MKIGQNWEFFMRIGQNWNYYNNIQNCNYFLRIGPNYNFPNTKAYEFQFSDLPLVAFFLFIFWLTKTPTQLIGIAYVVVFDLANNSDSVNWESLWLFYMAGPPEFDKAYARVYTVALRYIY